ncbi:polysaccharide deacetylase family protein [Bacillus sp. Bva_UNVM-123]|uniref:polysaccharide deacetylase family protein n=1 Tax=Bacillus sp. Bva_UNVM-123 TaxID=2829798 RepID=UPI00391FB68C
MFKYFVVSFFLFLTFFLSSVPTEALTRSRAEYEKTGHVIWEIKTDEKLISITFDDGPDPVYTPQILDLLDKFNAKATFFVTGHKADTYPELIKRIVKEGHEVGNHTYNHMRGNKIDSKKLKNELK